MEYFGGRIFLRPPFFEVLTQKESGTVLTEKVKKLHIVMDYK